MIEPINMAEGMPLETAQQLQTRLKELAASIEAASLKPEFSEQDITTLRDLGTQTEVYARVVTDSLTMPTPGLQVLAELAAPIVEFCDLVEKNLVAAEQEGA